MRGSSAIRSTTMAARIAPENAGTIGRCIDIQAVPSGQSASAIVSQPLASANVNASASAASRRSQTARSRPAGPAIFALAQDLVAPHGCCNITARMAKGIDVRDARCGIEAIIAPAA